MNKDKITQGLKELYSYAENTHKIIPVEGNKLGVSIKGSTAVIYYKTPADFYKGYGVYLINRRNACFYEEFKREYERLSLMVDCSRNAVMSIPSLKKLIRILALLGYTELQLYTEDTYEVRNEPFFGYLRGRYTKEEIQGIDSYCDVFGIELVPCIQTLAHLNRIYRWKEYWVRQWIQQIYF